MSKYYRVRIDKNDITESFVTNFRINKKQHKIIMLVYQMTSITATQISKILDIKVTYLRNILRKLYDNAFIDRQFEIVQSGEGSGAAIYFLDYAGKIYVAGALNISYRDVKWRKNDNLLHNIKLNHTLGIAELRADFTMAIEKRDDIGLEEWKSEKEIGWLNFKVDNKDYTFSMDGFISISKTENEQTYLYDFFIEFDRTMSSKDFAKKFVYYEMYKKSSHYKEKFEIYPRVLIITNTRKKAELIKNRLDKRKNELNIKYFIRAIDDFKRDPLDGGFK
jgi:hypothetical protein